MSDHALSDGSSVEPLQAERVDAAGWYERGLTLRKAGLFRQAIEQLDKASSDPCYALKAFAQIGLCHKALRQYEQAVTAFRDALKAPVGSTKETVQVLYALGRTLESVGRIAEAIDVYRWLRREDQQFRDVAARIEYLSAARIQPEQRRAQWPGLVGRPASSVWQRLLRSTK